MYNFWINFNLLPFQLYLDDIAIEGHATCGYDALIIRVGSQEYPKQCGSTWRSITSPVSGTGDIYVAFTSDSSTGDSGFRIRYSSKLK